MGRIMKIKIKRLYIGQLYLSMAYAGYKKLNIDKAVL